MKKREKSSKRIKTNKNINSKQSQKIPKWIFWTPRILSILFLLFLALFSLDTFGNNYTFWETVLGLFMHNIPVIVLAILLWISWKHELVGAITFISAGLLYILMLLMNKNLEWYMLSWSITIAGPAFFVGIMFWINWKLKKK
jgi:hypothetical protein